MSDRIRMIIGYVQDKALTSITPDDARKLTHINIAFGHIASGKVSVAHTRNLCHIEVLRTYNPSLKILLSVGGWSAGGFSEAASSDDTRRVLARSAVSVIKDYQLDGIDLDWEYPCYSVAGIESRPEDRDNFTLLLRELRAHLDQMERADNRRYFLSIAAGADQYYIDGTRMDQVQQYLDWVQLMTYDMRGGFQTLTGHHTNLYTPTGDLFRVSVDSSVRMFCAAGVPKHKLVIGAAFYSRMWKDVPNRNHGLFQNSSGAGGYGPGYSDLVENYLGKNGYRRYWDEEAKAPFLFDGSNFITYDDEESIAAKCKYVKENDLAGIMFWEYSCDASHTLLDSIHRSMNHN